MTKYFTLHFALKAQHSKSTFLFLFSLESDMATMDVSARRYVNWYPRSLDRHFTSVGSLIVRG